MKALNRVKLLLSLLLGVVFFSFLSAPASASALPYRALKYGTDQNSMATGYFVRPAAVTVQNHHYVVTMQIKTAKNLSSFPVKVLAVNGGLPENVRKVKDRAGNSRYYYSFTATSLKKPVTAKLAIDVPKVYKAHHLIWFKFRTASLPKLTVTATHSRKTTTPIKKVHSTKKARPLHRDTTRKVASSTAVPKKSSESKKTTSVPTSHTKQTKSQAKGSTSSSTSTPTSSSQKASSTTNKSPKKKTSHTPWIIGGVVVIVAAIGGGSWLIFRH